MMIYTVSDKAVSAIPIVDVDELCQFMAVLDGSIPHITPLVMDESQIVIISLLPDGVYTTSQLFKHL